MIAEERTAKTERRMKTARKRAKKRLAVFFFIVGLALIVMLLLYAPVFNISAIEVLGSTRYPDKKIIGMSGIKIGENGFRKLRLEPESILKLRLTDSERKISQLPYVKSCTVNLVFPDKVSVKVTERQPAAYIRYLDNYLTVDGEGYVLEAAAQRPSGEGPSGLVEIRGIEFSKYTLGGRLEASDVELIKKGTEIIKAIKSSDADSDFILLDVLDWIDMVGMNNAMLSLDDNRITVRFDPSDKLQYTIDFTKEIFFKKINSKETGTIEFMGENPNFIPE